METTRRSLFTEVAALSPAATEKTISKPFVAGKSGMRHRNWIGKLAIYLINDPAKREFAREVYDVTVQPDGAKTIRQMSEWDDVEFLKDEPSCDLGHELSSRTLKDLVLNVGPDFTAASAFVQFFSKQVFQGSAYYDFRSNGIQCDGSSLQQGRFTESFAYENVRPFFYFHSIMSDINWYLAGMLDARRGKTPPPDRLPRLRFMATASLLGNTGPVLIKPLAGPEGGRPFFEPNFIAEETITVGAGTFRASHCQVIQTKTGQVLDYWITGEDNIPVRCASHGLHWDLVELVGDYR